MIKIDTAELNNRENLSKYPEDTIFVLRDDKVLLPPEIKVEFPEANDFKINKNTTGQ